MTSCIVLLVREDILTNYNVNNNLFCRYSQRDHAIKFDYKKNEIKTNTLHNFLNIAANLCGISVHTGFQSGFVFLFFLRLLLIKTLDVAVALFYIFATHLGGFFFLSENLKIGKIAIEGNCIAAVFVGKRDL